MSVSGPSCAARQTMEAVLTVEQVATATGEVDHG